MAPASGTLTRIHAVGVRSGCPCVLDHDLDAAGPFSGLVQDRPPGFGDIQDAIFGTTLQIMGPAETAYLSQARAVYPILDVAPPTTALRPQAVVVDERQRAQLAELGSSVEEIYLHAERVEVIR